MFGGLAFLCHGNMAMGVVGGELMARVGPDAREDALEFPHAREMDFTGRSMKGFVYVALEGLSEYEDLATWSRLVLGQGSHVEQDQVFGAEGGGEVLPCSQAGMVNNPQQRACLEAVLPPLSGLRALGGEHRHPRGALPGAAWGLGQLVTGGLSDRIGRKWLIVGGLTQVATIRAGRRHGRILDVGDGGVSSRCGNGDGVPHAPGSGRGCGSSDLASASCRGLQAVARRRVRCGRVVRRGGRRRSRPDRRHLRRCSGHGRVGSPRGRAVYETLPRGAAGPMPDDIDLES